MSVKPPKPELSYKDAMKQFIIAGHGKISTVEQCSSPAFFHQVKQAIELVATTKQREGLKKELLDLDYSELVSRYYAITRLAKYNVIFCYEFYIDDRNSKTNFNVV